MSQQEQWQLTGIGPESYEQFQVPSMFEPLARSFLNHVPLQSGHRVLDVACGTGIVARLAAPKVAPGGRVLGVDLNADMLGVARRVTPGAGNEIAWRQGDAAALPSVDAAFDVVLCQQGLQFFPDRPAALREMHRVLVPGGCLALCVWRSIEHSPCNLASAAALARHLGADAAARIRAPFALGDPAELRALIGAAGFRDITLHEATVTRRMLAPKESIPGHLASTPVGPEVVALDEATRAALVKEIGTALQPYRDADGLAVPQATHITVARK